MDLWRVGMLLLVVVVAAACVEIACAGAPASSGDSISQGELQCKPPELSAPPTPMPQFLWNLPLFKRAPRDLAVPCYPYFSHATPSKIVPPPDPIIPVQIMAVLLASMMLGVLVLIVARFGSSSIPEPSTEPALQEIEINVVRDGEEEVMAGPSESSGKGDVQENRNRPPQQGLVHWDSVLEAEVVRLEVGSSISWDAESNCDGPSNEVEMDGLTTTRAFTSD
ncbi:hypothetical protein BSKO_08075 [Bryopsis sp. KO-2023]|nr:hypothetical protein BSKO_08075 [Bryopsis sp. KO-2023]